ncbi:MAG: glycosyltransferase family 2 protein [Candidatus Omnitrophica bacterium]|nr:glycosyltransferase family 2 protein [Candidatus Omnitrophota bacterium]
MCQGRKKPSVSVIMPALNEEKAVKDAIEATLSVFREYDIDGEVIVINDGSTDSTAEAVSSMINTYGPDAVKLLNHDSPKGMGASFLDGVKHAKKDTVTLNPGDNENDPSEILRYADLIEDVDVVLPFVYNKEVRSSQRNAISFLFRSIINVTFGTSFNYTNGTALYRRSVLSGIECRSSGFFFLAEIIIKIAKKGYLIAEVPYALSRREGGKSKAVRLRPLIRVTKDYLRLIKEIYFSKKYVSKINEFPEDSATFRRQRIGRNI